MRSRALLAVVLLAAGVGPLAGTASADPSSHDLRIDIDRRITDADTFMFSVQLDLRDGDPDHFNIANGSFFQVEGFYPSGGANESDAGRQDAAGMLGVVRYNTGLDCTPQDTDNVDPCFMTASGISMKNVRDARVQAGPFTVEQDPNTFGWTSTLGEIGWDEERRFEVPPGQDQVVYRFFISIPDAVELDVDVHIHSPQDIETHRVIADPGGLVARGEDFEPVAGADTAPASAMVGGEELVSLEEPGERLYAAFGPGWNGATVAGFVGLRHNTAAVSNIAYEAPDGASLSGTALGVGGFSGILVPGSNTHGLHAFQTNYHAGAGPQDLYLIGYRGPTG